MKMRHLLLGALLAAATTSLLVSERPTVARLPAARRSGGRHVARGVLFSSAPNNNNANELLEEAARLRAEVAAAESSIAQQASSSSSSSSPAGAQASAMSDEEARAKITAALKRATQRRDKDELQIALAAAEAAGFSGTDPVVQKAVMAFNELRELSDAMRKRLVAEARSQGGDPSVDWNPGIAYAAIFVLVAVLVLVGGKDIFY